MLVPIQLRKDCADVQYRTSRVTLDGAQVLLKLYIIGIGFHQIVQVSFLLFIILQTRLKI